MPNLTSVWHKPFDIKLSPYGAKKQKMPPRVILIPRIPAGKYYCKRSVRITHIKCFLTGFGRTFGLSIVIS